MPGNFDALVLVSFGGPEHPAEVMPFLRRVTRGRDVPSERLAEVAEHYFTHGGSPINEQNRQLVTRLKQLLPAAGVDLPVYWGNRNWHPLLKDTVTAMAADGVRKALAFVTSAFGSYSGCRQYQEDIAAACVSVPSGFTAPEIQKLRLFYNHPGFIEPMAEGIANAARRLDDRNVKRPRLIFCAHSIPTEAAKVAPYERQLREAAELISTLADGLLSPRPYVQPSISPLSFAWDLVFQSRSGNPRTPWLEPDVNAHLRSLARSGVKEAVLVPLGFVSDHMEVIHDLDTEALATATEVGIQLVRSPTVGTHRKFLEMIVALIKEKTRNEAPLWLGDSAPSTEACLTSCCQYKVSG